MIQTSRNSSNRTTTSSVSFSHATHEYSQLSVTICSIKWYYACRSFVSIYKYNLEFPELHLSYIRLRHRIMFILLDLLSGSACASVAKEDCPEHHIWLALAEKTDCMHLVVRRSVLKYMLNSTMIFSCSCTVMKRPLGMHQSLSTVVSQMPSRRHKKKILHAHALPRSSSPIIVTNTIERSSLPKFHSTIEPEPRRLQPTQSLPRRHIPPTILIRKIL